MESQMKTDSSPKPVSQYVTVFRAPSALIIPVGTSLKIRVPRPLGSAIVKFRTRHVDKGTVKGLPGDLWVDVRGPAETVEEAVSTYGGISGELISIISFAANASIGELDPHLVFDNTPGSKIHNFLQSMIPDESPILHVGRKLNTEATLALIDAIEVHSEKERIGRAISQYSLALRYWRWGLETLAIAHLYIGIETLTKAVIRCRQACGINDKEFACQLGIKLSDLGPCESLTAAIETTVRKSIIFQGDEQCYKEAKAASDGFEHGFMPFDQIRNKARLVRNKTATCLREAILDMLVIKKEHRDILLSSPYDTPLGHWPVVKYMRGKLLGESDKLAAEGQKYPFMLWHSRIESMDSTESHDYHITMTEKLTVCLGSDVKFQLERFEAWQP
jgi:hypothetical protein